MIAAPALEHASPILASEFVLVTSMVRCARQYASRENKNEYTLSLCLTESRTCMMHQLTAIQNVLVSVVTAVVVPVARPETRDALSILACQFGVGACVVQRHAHPVVVDELLIRWAFAFSLVKKGKKKTLGCFTHLQALLATLYTWHVSNRSRVPYLSSPKRNLRKRRLEDSERLD